MVDSKKPHAIHSTTYTFGGMSFTIANALTDGKFSTELIINRSVSLKFINMNENGWCAAHTEKCWVE